MTRGGVFDLAEKGFHCTPIQLDGIDCIPRVSCSKVGTEVLEAIEHEVPRLP